MKEIENFELPRGSLPMTEAVYTIVEAKLPPEIEIINGISEEQNKKGLSEESQVALSLALQECQGLFVEKDINSSPQKILADINYGGRRFKKGEHPSMQSSFWNLDEYSGEKVRSVELRIMYFFSDTDFVSMYIHDMYHSNMSVRTVYFKRNGKKYHIEPLESSDRLINFFNTVQEVIVHELG